MKIADIYKKKKKSLSFEIFPPKKDSELKNIDETLAVLCELNPDYINVPIIPGIMPVINASQIKRMITMCGATFPERFQKIISKYEDNKEALFDAGMSYALSQIIDLLVSDIDGIHLYTMNNPLVARKICEGIRNII